MNTNIFNRIKDDIGRATKQMGITLISESWGDKEVSCACALGCCLIANEIDLDESSAADKVSSLLGVSEKWIDAFIAGFDECPWEATINNPGISDEEIALLEEANKTGIEMRKALNPMPYDKFLKGTMPQHSNDDYLDCPKC